MSPASAMAVSAFQSIRYNHVFPTHHGVESLNAIDYIPLAFEPTRNNGFDVAIEGINGVLLHLWTTRSRTGYISVPTQHRDVLTLRIPLRGSFTRTYGSKDVVSRQDEATLLPFEDLRSFRASEHFEVLSMTLSRKGLLARRDALYGHPVVAPLDFAPTASLNTPGMRTLKHAALAMRERLKNTDESLTGTLGELIEEMFFYHILSAWPQREVPEDGPEAPARSVRAAMDFIDAHLAHPITITEIARAAGFGVRATQIAFRKEIDRTPLQYLIEQRLDRVHRDLALAEPGTTVIDTARRWGFVHPSDFARRYRQRFGCTPSETRRKRTL